MGPTAILDVMANRKIPDLAGYQTLVAQPTVTVILLTNIHTVMGSC